MPESNLVERGSREERRAYLMLIGTALCFGGAWVTGAWAVDEVTPLAVAAVRFGIAVLLLWAWALVTRRSLSPVSRRDVPLILALGVTVVAGYNWLFLTGLTLAPASDGAIIVPGLSPVFTAVLAGFVLRERLGIRGAFGFAVAITGLVLVIGPEGAAGEQRLVGDALFLAGATMWAAYSVLARMASRRFDALSTTLYSMVAGTLMLIPMAWLEGGAGTLTTASVRAWLSILYLAVLASVAAFVWFNAGVARIGAARATAFAYLVPVIGVATSAWLLGEAIAPLAVVGGAVVLVGVWLIQTRHRSLRQPVARPAT